MVIDIVQSLLFGEVIEQSEHGFFCQREILESFLFQYARMV